MPHDDYDEILIKNLTLDASIGIYDHEKENKQQVIISVHIKTKPIAGITSNEDIDNVLSYEDVVNKIKALVAENHIELVETLAATIADICLNFASALSVTVDVEKPDIIPNTSVGIRIKRSKRL